MLEEHEWSPPRSGCRRVSQVPRTHYSSTDDNARAILSDAQELLEDLRLHDGAEPLLQERLEQRQQNSAIEVVE